MMWSAGRLLLPYLCPHTGQAKSSVNTGVVSSRSVRMRSHMSMRMRLQEIENSKYTEKAEKLQAILRSGDELKDSRQLIIGYSPGIAKRNPCRKWEVKSDDN